MCLIAFALDAHPRHALVVCANRDEFFERPTAPASWWDDAPILAGRDLRGGGTWMGLSRRGRFVALTNVRDPARFRGDARSRGELVVRVLVDERPLDDALVSVAADAADYNGFTLLAADREAGGAMSVLRSSGSIERVAPGVHGLSNADLDTPWPKVVGARSDLAALVGGGLDDDALVDAGLALLSARDSAPDAELPATGVAREVERALSARFIAMAGYGTRSSAVVLVGRDGTIVFVERDRTGETRRFAFDAAR